MNNIKSFLIIYGDDEQEIFRVEAKSKKEAWELFANFKWKTEECLLEHIYSKVCNDGFAEKFFLKTKEEQEYFMENNAEILASDKLINQRIKKYFKNKIWSDLYADMIFNNANIEFPDEMIIFMYKDILKNDWCPLQIIELNSIKIIPRNI